MTGLVVRMVKLFLGWAVVIVAVVYGLHLATGRPLSSGSAPASSLARWGGWPPPACR